MIHLPERVILFDGVCNLCQNSVQFIIKRDPNTFFYFVSIQSDLGQKILKKYNIDPFIDSIVLIENEQVFVESTAVLKIASKLKGSIKFTEIFLFTPRFFRNFIYRLVAKKRYHWFGKQNECMLPLPHYKKRFLE